MDDDLAVLTAIAARLKSRTPASVGGDTSSGFVGNSHSAISPAPVPMEIERVSTADPAMGPLLRGTPEQLQAAREAMKGYNGSSARRGRSLGALPPRAVSSPPRALAKNNSNNFTPKRSSLLAAQDTAKTAGMKKLKTSISVDTMADRNMSSSSKMQGIIQSMPAPELLQPFTNLPNARASINAPSAGRIEGLQGLPNVITSENSKSVVPYTGARVPINANSANFSSPVAEGKVGIQSPISDKVNTTELRTTMSYSGTTEDKVAKLEKDLKDIKLVVFELSRRLETVIQAEEKRQYLGSDHIKTPFETSIICGKHKFKIQVNATMKVSDLIRRIRTHCNISPADSLNPRLFVGGVKMGHGMTLSEVGITSMSEAVFSYSGADEAAG